MPGYWDNKTGFALVHSAYVAEAMQWFVMHSFVHCNCNGSLQHMQVVSIERNKNNFLWQRYQTQRSFLQMKLAKLLACLPG